MKVRNAERRRQDRREVNTWSKPAPKIASRPITTITMLPATRRPITARMIPRTVRAATGTVVCIACSAENGALSRCSDKIQGRSPTRAPSRWRRLSPRIVDLGTLLPFLNHPDVLSANTVIAGLHR
jgi:hypothetical protein